MEESAIDIRFVVISALAVRVKAVRTARVAQFWVFIALCGRLIHSWCGPTILRASKPGYVPDNFSKTYHFDKWAVLRYRLENQQAVQPRRFDNMRAGVPRPPFDGRRAVV